MYIGKRTQKERKVRNLWMNEREKGESGSI
jgi:hypothetical protein